MYVLKGFLTHAQFANNNVGVVAPFGEISTQALTYAREKGIYKSALSADLELTTFRAAQDATPVLLTTDVVDHVVNITKYIYDRTISVHGEIFPDELLQDLLTTFATSASTFALGDMVQDNNGFWAPAWVSWKAVNVTGVDADNNFKVWLSDDAFKNQYDEYEIIIVAPTLNIDDFFKTGTEVETMLTANTPSQTMFSIQSAKGDYPETVIRAESYNYIDPYNAAHKVPATWYLLIYGAAGNNIDAINDAIVAEVLSHSVHTRDEWVAILPDLFRRTEFMMVPLWDQYSIPNRELQAGIYSPITNLKRALALIKQVVASYPSAHIDDHLDLLAHPYKSLAIATVGSTDNRNAWFEITDVFSDYIAVSSTSVDFARMSKTTQDWVLMLETMLIQAEAMGQYTSVPIGMTKVTRNGILYLVQRYDNINYLIAAKNNFPLPA